MSIADSFSGALEDTLSGAGAGLKSGLESGLQTKMKDLAGEDEKAETTPPEKGPKPTTGDQKQSQTAKDRQEAMIEKYGPWAALAGGGLAILLLVRSL